jgi:hydrogenase nickel incorporation protein HypA/HybF
MHELSIALSIIDMAGEEAARHGSDRVSTVYLKLGPLSGVVKDALLFSYEVASKGTPLEGSQLLIEEVPVIVHCPTCDKQQVIESIQCLCCPVCGTPTPRVVQGYELLVAALELESSADMPPGPDVLNSSASEVRNDSASSG